MPIGLTGAPAPVTVEAPISVEAWAKVNLTLAVVGRRPDGYHLLDSLVAFAGIGDTLAFHPATALSLEIDGPTAASLASERDGNIVLEAARRLAARTGTTAGAAIRLTKRLPVAAGIGGGSADAAAALTGLLRLWNVSLPEAELRALALELGADVPVCLQGRPARMSGVGEVLDPAPPLPPAWLVLANPGVPLSTPAVFKARAALAQASLAQATLAHPSLAHPDGGFAPAVPLTEAPADAPALAAALLRCRNDLTAAAVSLAPVIADLLAALAAHPGCLLARMSGSGATCFGLFAAQADAAAAAATLVAAHPTWWVAPAPLRA